MPPCVYVVGNVLEAVQLGIGHERLPREPCSPRGGARALPRRRLRGPSPVPGSPLWAHSSRLRVVCRVSLGVAGCSPRNSDTERPCTHSPFFLLSWERTPQTPRPSSHEDRLPFSCRGSVGPRFSGLSAPRPLPHGRAADTGSLGVRPPPRSTLVEVPPRSSWDFLPPRGCTALPHGGTCPCAPQTSGVPCLWL